METAIMYPEKCRKSIGRIVRETDVSVETAYAMMLMTAMLMDLCPEDEAVAEIVLKDCRRAGDEAS